MRWWSRRALDGGAPDWSRDGKTLIFNRDGRIWTIPVEGGSATILNTGYGDGLYGQPWAVAGWHIAGYQLQHARKAGDPRVYRAFDWWGAEVADGESVVVFS